MTTNTNNSHQQTMEDKLHGMDTKLETEATPTDTKDPITKEASAGQNTIDTLPPQSTKSIIIERLILCTALFFPLFLATLDTTIVATALPHIASSFDQLSDQSWIANAYILTNTAFLPAYGQVADIFGRHAVMQSAIFIFLIGSALCTGAQSWGMILAGRGIAGVGAAGCFIMTKIIMSDTNSLRENSTQNTFLALMFAVAYSIGPVLGGVLTSVSWRWCFGINLPVCVVAHIIFFFLLRKRVRTSTYDTPEQSRSLSFKLKKIDYFGLISFLAAFCCIILALVWGGSAYPWSSARIIVLLVLGSLLLITFIVIEYLIDFTPTGGYLPAWLRTIFTDATPMIPLEIFRDWDVCICQWNNLAGGMVMFGQFYYIAIYFTIVFSYTPQKAGQQLLYFLPGLGLGAWSAIFFILRVFHGTKIILIAGSVIMAVATGLFAMAVQQKAKNELFGFMAMLGVGVGLTLMPTQLHSQARMMQFLAIVTSLVSFFRSLGGILALTIMSSVVNNKVSDAFSSSLANTTNSTGSSFNSLGSIQSLPPDMLARVQDAFSDAIRWAYIALLPFVCIAAVSSFFLREVKIERSVEDEQRREAERNGDGEMGTEGVESSAAGETGGVGGSAVGGRRPRTKIYGPIGVIIWCCQAIGDKMGWRK